MTVEEIMSKDPYAASVTASVQEVQRMLAEADVRHIPIVEGHALVGIVSDRDLSKLSPSALDEFDHPDEQAQLLSLPIAKFMNADVVSVNPESEVSDVVVLMIEH
jgi:acetoin utilization protein AcuB